MQSERSFTLVRHGEAYKNIARQHGGQGSSLTQNGEEEARSIGKTIEKWNLVSPSIIVINKPQCIQTAHLLVTCGNLLSLEVINFPTFGLGVADGLSEEEVQNNFKDAAYILERWRSGCAEAHELRAIPGTTDPSWYFEQGQSFLLSIKNLLAERDVILVATRSVLVLIANILLGKTPDIGGGYREIPWKNAAYATFTMGTNGVFNLLAERTNVSHFS